MISVVIFSYNFEEFISECIHSVLDQYYQPCEIICVDDFSSDSTFEILTKLSYSNPKVRIFQNEFAKEKFNSLNQLNLLKTALNHSTGDYIFLLDGDDFWSPSKLLSYQDPIRNSADFFFDTPIKIFNGKEIPELLLCDYLNVECARACITGYEIPYFTTGQTSSLGFKTTTLVALIEKYRYDLTSVWLDVQLGRKAFFTNGITVYHSPGCLTYRRIHEKSDSLSLQNSAKWKEFKREYMELFGFEHWYTGKKMLSLLSYSVRNVRLFIKLIKWNVITVFRKYLRAF